MIKKIEERYKDRFAFSILVIDDWIRYTLVLTCPFRSINSAYESRKVKGGNSQYLSPGRGRGVRERDWRIWIVSRLNSPDLPPPWGVPLISPLPPSPEDHVIPTGLEGNYSDDWSFHCFCCIVFKVLFRRGFTWSIRRICPSFFAVFVSTHD